MSSSTWFWRDILSFISAWISMLVAKSLASKRSIISSLDSGIVVLSWEESFEWFPASADAKRSVRLRSVNRICSSVSHRLISILKSSQWLGDGIGVIWVDTVEMSAFVAFSLHFRISLARLLSFLRSPFKTRFDFFLVRLVSQGCYAHAPWDSLDQGAESKMIGSPGDGEAGTRTLSVLSAPC